MKTSSLIFGIPFLIGCIGYSPLVGSEEQSPVVATDKPGELVVEIEVNRYKDEQHQEEWDNLSGANPAPDVYGKIQLMEVECSIPVHEDSYLVKVTCPVKELKPETKVNVQLYDRDTFRLDDVIALGTVEYKDNPTEVTVGRAKIKLLYNKLPPAQPEVLTKEKSPGVQSETLKPKFCFGLLT